MIESTPKPNHINQTNNIENDNQNNQPINIKQLPNNQIQNNPINIINQQIQIQPDIQKSQKPPTFFHQYISILKSKILKRKIILFILNIILTLSTIVFAIFFIVWNSLASQSQSQIRIQTIFNTQFSYITLLFIVFIGVLSAFFSIIIIKGKVIMLHCYWITCLVFLVIFSIVGASAFSLISMDCQQPSSYVLQKIKLTSNSANNIFCSDICPCNINGAINSNNYDKIQDCPGWDQTIYSSFLSTMEQNFKCSGWCSINQKSYFTFYQNSVIPQASLQFSCFESIRNKINYDTAYLRVFSLILCTILVVVIFYTNYYIFMQKQDQNNEIKNVQKKIRETQQKMQDQLRTSKRMLY